MGSGLRGVPMSLLPPRPYRLQPRFFLGMVTVVPLFAAALLALLYWIVVFDSESFSEVAEQARLWDQGRAATGQVRADVRDEMPLAGLGLVRLNELSVTYVDEKGTRHFGVQKACSLL